MQNLIQAQTLYSTKEH